MRRGFTIVELLIIIIVMGILLTLTFVNLSSSQVNARDSERKADIESIALAFETGVKNPHTTENEFLETGNYPGEITMNIALPDNITTLLPDIDPKALRAPGVSESSPVSLVLATNDIQTATGVLPAPTINTYVYQPIDNLGGLCEDACGKFNLYYRLEADNTVYMLTSKHQQ